MEIVEGKTVKNILNLQLPHGSVADLELNLTCSYHMAAWQI
jgi:hypothetical protein